MKVLVIGGSGFLGQSLFRVLKTSFNSSDHSIFCGDLVDPEIEGVSFLNLNVLDSESCTQIKGRFDVIINLIGQVTRPINVCYNLNTIGIQNIVDNIKDTSTNLIHISTVSIYGSYEFADENTLPNPETPYSTCKAFAEYLMETSLNAEQLTIIRISNLYGLMQQKGILSYLFRSYQSDRKLFFNNDGSLVRYYLNVEDCALNICKFFNENGSFVSGKYNLLGNDRYTVKELISLFEKLSGTEFETAFDPVKPYDNTIRVASEEISKKIDLEFNYSIEGYFKSKIEA